LRGIWLCEECLDRAPIWSPPWCQRCGVPDAIGCRCAEVPPVLDAARSVGLYSNWLDTSVRQLKYGQESARAAHLGSLMATAIADLPAVELLTPVPLHRRRQNERGYNQAILLADAIARETGIPVETSAFRRTVDTPHQTRLSAVERQRNLAGAFTITEPHLIAHRRVLVVDDVFTTGATSGEFAAALRSAGASWVGVATAGRAMRVSDS
jgi:ComF family protein